VRAGNAKLGGAEHRFAERHAGGEGGEWLRRGPGRRAHFRLYALAKQPPEERTIAFDPKQLGVFSFSVEDFSISPDGVLYVAAYVNFGLGDSRYALLRYAFLEAGAEPQVRHLPDVRCRFLGAGVHGVWCLDPEPREMRAEPPTLTWIAFLGTVRRYTVLREPGISLGPPRVVVAGDDVAETWLPSMRAFLEAHPMGGVRTQAPIPVDPSSRALTSFAVSPGTIDTPFHEVFSTPEMLRNTVATIPLGRVGAPVECATAIAFLASDAASFVVGETMEVNGGQLML